MSKFDPKCNSAFMEKILANKVVFLPTTMVHSHKNDQLAPVRLFEGGKTTMVVRPRQVASHQPLDINHKQHPTLSRWPQVYGIYNLK